MSFVTKEATVGKNHSFLNLIKNWSVECFWIFSGIYFSMHKGLNVLKNIFFEALGPKYGFLKFQKMELSFSYFLHEIAIA